MHSTPQHTTNDRHFKWYIFAKRAHRYVLSPAPPPSKRSVSCQSDLPACSQSILVVALLSALITTPYCIYFHPFLASSVSKSVVAHLSMFNKFTISENGRMREEAFDLVDPIEDIAGKTFGILSISKAPFISDIKKALLLIFTVNDRFLH